MTKPRKLTLIDWVVAIGLGILVATLVSCQPDETVSEATRCLARQAEISQRYERYFEQFRLAGQTNTERYTELYLEYLDELAAACD